VLLPVRLGNPSLLRRSDESSCGHGPIDYNVPSQPPEPTEDMAAGGERMRRKPAPSGGCGNLGARISRKDVRNALAKRPSQMHKERAFQASSPKT
jgi:hypothetical protein